MMNEIRMGIQEIEIHLIIGQRKMDAMIEKKQQLVQFLNELTDKPIDQRVKRKASTDTKNASYADVARSNKKSESRSKDHNQLRINHAPKSNGKGFLLTKDEMDFERSKYNAKKRKIKNNLKRVEKKRRGGEKDEKIKIHIDFSQDSP